MNDIVTVSSTEVVSVISVLSNDTDPDGDQIFMTTNFTQPSSGSVQWASGANSNFLYTPLNGFTGTVTFTYEITDGQETDTAKVTINVKPKNLCPDPTDEGNPNCPCGPGTPIPVCR